MERTTIDIEKLREALRQEALGAAFGGGFGGALIDVADIETASPEELIRIAERYGLDLGDYEG